MIDFDVLSRGLWGFPATPIQIQKPKPRDLCFTIEDQNGLKITVTNVDPRTQAVVEIDGFVEAIGESKRNPKDEVNTVYGIRKAMQRALEQTDLTRRFKSKIWDFLHSELAKKGHAI